MQKMKPFDGFTQAQQQLVLTKCIPYFFENIGAGQRDNLLVHLATSGLINSLESDMIDCKKTHSDKVMTLLDLIKAKQNPLEHLWLAFSEPDVHGQFLLEELRKQCKTVA